MHNEKDNMLYYTKLFLLMIIPVYGLIFTMLLAFSKEVTGELNSLARGALIARIVFLILIGVGVAVFITTILPSLNNVINNFGTYKLF